MSNVIVTPNMNLPNPVPSVDPGPDYANNLSNSLNILDSHNHSLGQGVQITPSGININSDLPLNGNNETLIRSTRYTAQSPAISNPEDIGCLYVSGPDLYYNDTAGNQVKLTSGGAVNATSSGISNGTATASFVSSVLVVDSASNTPANIQAGSVLIGNNIAASNFATVSAPNALAASYSLVLPQLPGATSFMSLDTSGNMAATVATTNGIQQSNLYKRTTGTTASAGNVALSASSGVFSTANEHSYDPVTNLSVTITTTGRPVVLMISSDTTGAFSSLQTTATGGASLVIIRDSNALLPYANSKFGGSNNLLPSLISIDLPASGSHTYAAQLINLTSGTTTMSNMVLIAYEL